MFYVPIQQLCVFQSPPVSVLSLPGYRRKCSHKLSANGKPGLWSAGRGSALPSNGFLPLGSCDGLWAAHGVLRRMKTKANEASCSCVCMAQRLQRSEQKQDLGSSNKCLWRDREWAQRETKSNLLFFHFGRLESNTCTISTLSWTVFSADVTYIYNGWS